MIAGKGLVEAGIAGLDHQCAALRHGVPRVDREVEKGTFQLTRIDFGLPQSPSTRCLYLDRLAQSPAEQVYHATDQGVGIDGLRLKHLFP